MSTLLISLGSFRCPEISAKMFHTHIITSKACILISTIEIKREGSKRSFPQTIHVVFWDLSDGIQAVRKPQGVSVSGSFVPSVCKYLSIPLCR